MRATFKRRSNTFLRLVYVFAIFDRNNYGISSQNITLSVPGFRGSNVNFHASGYTLSAEKQTSITIRLVSSLSFSPTNATYFIGADLRTSFTNAIFHRSGERLYFHTTAVRPAECDQLFLAHAYRATRLAIHKPRRRNPKDNFVIRSHVQGQ